MNIRGSQEESEDIDNESKGASSRWEIYGYMYAYDYYDIYDDGADCNVYDDVYDLHESGFEIEGEGVCVWTCS